MSERFQYAMASVQNGNLIELARHLTGAVAECLRENQYPHHDPAVRFICFQIAFAGNGDNVAQTDYEKLYEYCRLKSLNGPNYEMLKQEIDNAEPPVPQST
jgi:hypothetical protein